MVRRSPRKHKVREHGRGKPTGGRTGVDEYTRGRGGESKTSASAGGRAQIRTSFLEVKDVLTRAETRAPEFIEFDDKQNVEAAFYRRRRDAKVQADRTGVEVIPMRKTHQGETRKWYSVWGEKRGVVAHPKPGKKKPAGRSVADSMKKSLKQTARQTKEAADSLLGEKDVM